VRSRQGAVEGAGREVPAPACIPKGWAARGEDTPDSNSSASYAIDFPRTPRSEKAADILFPWTVSASKTRPTLCASVVEAYRLIPVTRRRQRSTRGWSPPEGFSPIRPPLR
jgi:hypothetical protein